MSAIRSFARAVTGSRWFELGIIAIILLLNLVVGAIVNNYQAVMEASRNQQLANRGRSGRN